VNWKTLLLDGLIGLIVTVISLAAIYTGGKIVQKDLASQVVQLCKPVTLSCAETLTNRKRDAGDLICYYPWKGTDGK